MSRLIMYSVISSYKNFKVIFTHLLFFLYLLFYTIEK